MGGKAYEAFGRYTRVHTRRFGESFERRYARFCGRGESLGRHSEGRTPARFFLWTWALLALAILVTPAYAVVDYSEMGIAWGPTTVDASTSPRQVGEILVTNSRNNAAVLVVGGNLLDTRLDHDVMAKLSNEGTGGAFYELTQLVHRYYATDGEYEYPNWANWGQFDTLANVYGRDYIFWIQCTEAQIASAKEDYEAVLNGADLGGGGGSNQPGQLPTFFSTDSSVIYKLGSFEPVTTPVEITLSGDFLSRANTTLASHGPYWAYSFTQRSYNPRDGSSFFRLYISSEPFSLYLLNGWMRLKSDSTIYYLDSQYVSGTNGKITLNGSSVYTSGTNTVSGDFAYTSAFATNNQNIGWSNIGDGGAPVVPPTNWPDNPTVTPTPLPDPPSDTPVYPPQVTGPDVTVPAEPDLSDLLDALNEHCIHLQDAIYNGFNDYYETITSYYSDVVEWLQDWFEYLDEQLDSYFRQDIGIGKLANQWLSQIYNKLDDIDAKLDGLGGKLETNDIPSSYDDSNVATDGSSVLVGAYNNLRTKFPFSLLDSLANFATRLKHQAVAPDFDLPVGSPFGSHDPFTVEIDLTPYSDWAAIVRTGEVLAVYVALARRAAAMWTREGEGA